jgi:hypothetical protein
VDPDSLLARLSAADCLRLSAFDAELRAVPRPLIAAIWAGVDALDAQDGPKNAARENALSPS